MEFFESLPHSIFWAFWLQPGAYTPATLPPDRCLRLHSVPHKGLSSRPVDFTVLSYHSLLWLRSPFPCNTWEFPFYSFQLGYFCCYSIFLQHLCVWCRKEDFIRWLSLPFWSEPLMIQFFLYLSLLFIQIPYTVMNI